ncbi:hypothetical protein BBJ28_00006272 [Nothophytophthora sp. Chile5]|nr:hypothetical protein BBJ28_00006272 [Nothophytophthora sp. Chile5]
MGGLWRASRNPRKLLGGIAMISGGLFGASYGILSIRRGMFMDILMLPGDKSPFAGRARDILASKTPPSSGLPPPPRRYDNEVSSSLPPITGLDTPRGRERANDWQREDPEAFGEPNDSQRRSPFSFGAKQPPADDATDLDGRDLPPLSHDPYAHYSRGSRRPEADKNMPPLRHDEDEYFFDTPSDGDAPTKPTTWEEIRRRAAEQRKRMSSMQVSDHKSGGLEGTGERLEPYTAKIHERQQRSDQRSPGLTLAKSNNGSTKALSYEGFQSQEELAVLRAIVAREAGLDALFQCCCSFEDDQRVELLEAIIRVRELSLAAVEALAGWRRRMIQIQPFPWRNLNYLLKMTCDLDFLSKSQLATVAMDGMRLPRRNPFSTIGGLDHSMRVFWEVEMPEEDDLPVLLDSASFASSQLSVDLPSKIRLAECFLLYEERRYGKLSKVQAAADHRMKSLIQKEAEFASKARFGLPLEPDT